MQRICGLPAWKKNQNIFRLYNMYLYVCTTDKTWLTWFEDKEIPIFMDCTYTKACYCLCCLIVDMQLFAVMGGKVLSCMRHLYN